MARSTFRRLEREQVGVGLAGAVAVVEVRVEHDRDPRQQLDLRVVVGELGQRLLPHLDQLALLLELDAEALQLGAGVGAARVEQVGLAHRRERGLGVAELVLFDAGDLEEVRGGGVGRAERLGLGPAHAQHPHLRAVVAQRVVDRLEQVGDLQLDVAVVEQPLEQLARVLVVRVGGDDALQQIDGPVGVAQLVHAQPGAAAGQVVALGVAVDALGPATEQLLERVVVVLALAVLVHAGQRGHGAEVLGHQVEQLLGGAGRDLAVVQHVAGDGDDLLEQALLLAGVEDDVGAAAVELEQLLVGAAAGQQVVERVVGDLVGLVAVEQLGERGLGLVVLLEVVAQRDGAGQQQVLVERLLLLPHRPPLGLGGLLGPAHVLEDLAVGARDQVHALQLAAGPLDLAAQRRVLGVHHEQLAADAERVGAAALHLAVQRGQAGQAVRARRGVGLGHGDDLHRLGLAAVVVDAAVVRQEPAHDGERARRVEAAQHLERVDRRQVIGLDVRGSAGSRRSPSAS
ncbi:hypothetical protein [Nannocystis pusilla]|uniref:hypothetical protein n=1 Tax=Nannocystis pusilla TaxID=889268 RepID=UPI003DA43D44